MASQHTPGEWYLTRDGNLVVTDTQYIVRILDGDKRAMSAEERAANASLITKAPEMYAAIVSLLNHRDSNMRSFAAGSKVIQSLECEYTALRRIIDAIEVTP